MAQTEQKNQNVKKQFEELQSLLERAMALQTSMVLFEWDDETLAPKGAAEHTARVIGSVGNSPGSSRGAGAAFLHSAGGIPCVCRTYGACDGNLDACAREK